MTQNNNWVLAILTSIATSTGVANIYLVCLSHTEHLEEQRILNAFTGCCNSKQDWTRLFQYRCTTKSFPFLESSSCPADTMQPLKASTWAFPLWVYGSLVLSIANTAISMYIHAIFSMLQLLIRPMPFKSRISFGNRKLE